MSYDYQIFTESSESPLAFLTSFYLSRYSISLHLFIFLVREAVKNCFLGIIPEPADPLPPIGTFRNENLNFGQI